jgi:hypothetical protein
MADKPKFEGLSFKCAKCEDLIVLRRPREFGQCGCGASSGDAGDGHYYRLGGEAVWWETPPLPSPTTEAILKARRKKKK